MDAPSGLVYGLYDAACRLNLPGRIVQAPEGFFAAVDAGIEPCICPSKFHLVS